jgi:hypothetical protein
VIDVKEIYDRGEKLLLPGESCVSPSDCVRAAVARAWSTTSVEIQNSAESVARYDLAWVDGADELELFAEEWARPQQTDPRAIAPGALDVHEADDNADKCL